MQLEIITPNKKIFEGEVESATFPGSKGSFQVLKDHAAIISSLAKGKVKYRENNNKEQELMVEGGVVEVRNNHIVLLVERVITDE
jgi:F-type H+-transporting ATPase subunit epsilon